MNISLIPTAMVVHARDEEHARQLLLESGLSLDGDEARACARAIADGSLLVVREAQPEFLDDGAALADDAPWLVEMAVAQ